MHNYRIRESDPFIALLAGAVGKAYVLHRPQQTRRFSRGYRYGSGHALAVVRPGSLVEQWRVLKLCIESGKIVIMQAANTGLTGGSTPFGEDYDRDVVIVNTMRIKGIHLIDSGAQAVCLPGTTLDELERILKPIGREPHSVIGSSCLGSGLFNRANSSMLLR